MRSSSTTHRNPLKWARQAGVRPSWRRCALAARRRRRRHGRRQGPGGCGGGAAERAPLLCDVGDAASLEAVAGRARLVLNCTARIAFGLLVVAACVSQGSHCMDLCGEPEPYDRATCTTTRPPSRLCLLPRRGLG